MEWGTAYLCRYVVLMWCPAHVSNIQVCNVQTPSPLQVDTLRSLISMENMSLGQWLCTGATLGTFCGETLPGISSYYLYWWKYRINVSVSVDLMVPGRGVPQGAT